MPKDTSDLLSCRLGDTDDPHRAEHFDEAMAPSGANRTVITRALVDAYIAFEKTHKRPPRLPFILTEAAPEIKALRAAETPTIYRATKPSKPPKKK